MQSENADLEALAFAAAAPADSGLADAIRDARGTGISLFSILQLLYTHRDDIAAAIAAIRDLVAKLRA